MRLPFHASFQRLVAGALVLSASVAGPRRAQASPQELFGVGPRDLAVAGAMTAIGDHPGCAYYDPAALADSPRLRFSAAWVQADSSLDIDGRREHVEPVRGTALGLTLPFPLRGWLADRMAMGLVLSSPNDKLIRVYSRPAEEPQFVLLQNHGQVMGVYGGGSFRIDRSWAVGLGIRFLADVKARVRIVSDENGTDATSDGFLSTTMKPIFAVRYAPPDRPWRVAATYRHRMAQQFDTPAENDLGGLRASTPGLAATTQFVPTQVALGSAWERPAWTASLDLSYKRWSQFPNPTMVMGRIPATTATFPAFRDTVAVAAGGERRWNVGRRILFARAGYGFEPTPAPEMTDDYNLFDNDRHRIGLGGGVAMPWREGRIRFDVGLQAQALASRTHRKAASAVPEGTELVHETGGRLLAAAAGVSWEY